MIKKTRRRQVFSIALIFSMLASCTGSNEPGKSQALSLKLFTIQNSSLRKSSVVVQSDDGYSGKILFNHSDTVYFNFGYDIDNLSEKDPAVIYYPYNEADIRNNLDTALVDPSKIIYSRKPNFDIDEFRKQNVYFEMISGYRSKITIPREIKNNGITGVYVDSLRNDDGGRLKFNLYAKNLDSIQNQDFLRTIRSINFHIN